MRIPFTILSLFLVASLVLIIGNRPQRLTPRIRSKSIEERIDRSIPATSVLWLDSTQNLGNVMEGTVVDVQFRFKNTGNKMLVITDVAASCGCTVPEKPEKPIAPGAEGVIKATFDSKNRIGTNHKVITVILNTENRTQQLVFDVEVIPSK
jgi:hypothetical protein